MPELSMPAGQIPAIADFSQISQHFNLVPPPVFVIHLNFVPQFNNYEQRNLCCYPGAAQR